jgi:hypothetical protein
MNDPVLPGCCAWCGRPTDRDTYCSELCEKRSLSEADARWLPITGFEPEYGQS